MSVRHIVVRSLSARATRGRLSIGQRSFPCALGRSGSTHAKREGDGATPKGRYGLDGLFIRRDKVFRPRSGAIIPRRIGRQDGWCDDSRDRNYNRFVRHPYPASAERMFRDDDLYDLVVVLSHNRRPRVRGKGSAIFMHVARPGYLPTEGCIALSKRDLMKVIAVMGRRTKVVIV